MRTNLMRAGLNLMHAARLHHLLAPHFSGRGIIFTLHHVRPPEENPVSPGFAPNRILEISPQFLDQVIRSVRNAGYDLVSLNEAVERLDRPDAAKFASFTLDDGYMDNIVHALPVFQRLDCPFTVFVTTGIIEGTCELWWLALERIIADNPAVDCRLGGSQVSFTTDTPEARIDAFRKLYRQVRNMDQKQQRSFIRTLADRYRLDLEGLCRSLAMTWDDVRMLTAHPLSTVGAHTVNHYALAALNEGEAYAEMTGSRSQIADQTGEEPALFCYPYGDRASAASREFAMVEKAGFKAAVTTRKGMLFDEHAGYCSALPRVSLNGEYQALKFVELFLTGAPFAVWNGFRRLNVT